MDELDLFADFAERHLRLESGAPLVIEDFQRTILGDYFGGATESLILIPKKNGKSTLIAALALFHMATTPDAETVVVAASRDQAGVLFGQSAGFVRRSSWLRKRMRPTLRELRSRTDAGRVRVLAADANTADGVIPSLAIVDELGRHKSAELYSVLRDGLGPRKGRLLAISTAGDDEESPLGEMRRQAHAMKEQRRDGCYRYARSDDRSFVLHEWALSPDDDRDDLALVKQANPASWQTVEALRRRFDSPSMTTWAWARFACGVWMVGQDSAISEKEWKACEVSGCEIPADHPGVFVGIDLGWKWDTTAMVPVCRYGEKVRVHRPTILTPPQDGTSLDSEEVFDAAAAMRDRWPDCTFVLDPEAGGEQLAQRIDRELGGDLMTHSQRNRPMCHASQILSEQIAAGMLEHPGDDEGLTRHVLSASAKFVGTGWRLVKRRKSPLPIDAAVALAMALRVMAEGQTTETNSEVTVRKSSLYLA